LNPGPPALDASKLRCLDYCGCSLHSNNTCCTVMHLFFTNRYLLTKRKF